ncbi:hypothetical protein PIB30_067055 [Stylosanthes scabra]|uniref:Uncharacterized protein n=1 Tax=Stylosanthes scabra TaxID=79078 RepID=A0ABU6VMA0_9FABA|nr:hypothetical protein [Stylosanthes scabra]
MGDLSVILVTFFLLQILVATSDFISPIYEDVCKEVECGKGTCKPSKNSTFLYECECNPGWKQSLSTHPERFTFLPCIVPNCTLNYSCLEALAPAPHKERRSNESVFDACFWVDCGGGSCNMTSPFSYSCHCDAGYYNILNSTAFPCVKQCALGIGCSNLGIPMMNSSTAAPPPTVSESSKNEASSTPQGRCIGLLMLIMFMVSI